MMLETIQSPADLKRLSVAELESLASEIRQEIIETTLKNGGHLASNLGAVELTLALHYVFDTPVDKLVFDVGHQCYTHKLITGRYSSFSALRTQDGISGFPSHAESPFDTFDAGHASAAISQALGLAHARDCQKQDYHVVAVVGDGAIGGGMAFEALNDMGGAQDTRLIVVLNDNEMSISRNIGALSSHFSKLRSAKGYIGSKRLVKQALHRISRSGRLLRAVGHLHDSVRYFLIGETIFDTMGIKYLGPINGHSLPKLIDFLRRAKECPGPVILHTITCKGCGYEPAEENPERYHGVSAHKAGTDTVDFSHQMGKVLCRFAVDDSRVCAVTAGMMFNTGLKCFAERFPQRFFDTGIAEEHALGMAGGLARGGMRPFVVIYATFLQRGLDQVFHDICLQDVPVTICVDHAGLVGADGATHQGIYDLGFLRSMPNLTVLAPRDAEEMERMMRYALTCAHPVAIRYPKGGLLSPAPASFTFPAWEKLQDGEHGAVLSFGACLKTGKEVADAARMALYDARSLQPLDEAVLDEIAQKPIVVIEDNAPEGGLCEGVLAYYAAKGISARVRGFALKKEFVTVGTVAQQQRANGIDAQSVLEALTNAFR